MRQMQKVLSILVVTFLLFQALPLSTLAEQIVNEEDPTSIIPPPKKETEVPILSEIVEKREKYTKHFLKADKTYEADVYNTAIHYKENGVWKDIDNSLTEEADETNEKVLGNKKNKISYSTG